MSICILDQFWVLHTRAHLSVQVMTRVEPSGEKVHAMGVAMPSVVRVFVNDQSSVLHRRIRTEESTMTRVEPSGEKAHPVTSHASLWPASPRTSMLLCSKVCMHDQSPP